MIARLSCLILAIALSACGGGGGDDGTPAPPPSTPAPSGLTYSTAPTLVVTHPMTPLTPTVTNSVTSYSVSPTLPAGISLNTTSGVISGTPSAATPSAVYTVTAYNAGGTTSAAVTLAVQNDTPPTISYGSTHFTLNPGVPTTTIEPSTSGGAIVNWTITPALPAGLTFDSTNGRISGTPSAPTASAAYTVTAQNSGGSSTFVLNITVDAGVLLDLGHAHEIDVLRHGGTRVLSEDVTGHWALWNAQTAAKLASGDSTCNAENSRIPDDNPINGPPPPPTHCTEKPRAELAGQTFVINMLAGFELYSATDGALLKRITGSASSWWRLATDGSYLAAGDGVGVTVWSRSGDVIFTRAGNYSNASAFAAAGELRIAKGPAGANLIEKLSVPSGNSTTAPFPGEFHSWFLDGERFLTQASNTVGVYDLTGAQQGLTSVSNVENLTGQGEWFWTYRTQFSQVNIYAVGGTTPALSHDFPGYPLAGLPAGNTIGFLDHSPSRLTIFDLSGATPTMIEHTLPITQVTTYAATTSAQWAIGNQFGVVTDGPHPPGTPKYFGLGAALSIAGDGDRVAVSTASGKILYFNARTETMEGDIDSFSSMIRLGGGGTVLATVGHAWFQEFGTDSSVKIFSLPAGTEVNSWPYVYPAGPDEISLSASGTVIGTYKWISGVVAQARQEAFEVTGAPIWSDTRDFRVLNASVPVRPSPSGQLIAASAVDSDNRFGTQIVDDGTLSAAVSGWAAGWLDDERLLTNRYLIEDNRLVYEGSSVYGANGVFLFDTELPEVREFQPVAANRIYSPALNAILDVTTGNKVWTSVSSSLGQGAIAGGQVIFSSGATVRAEAY